MIDQLPTEILLTVNDYLDTASRYRLHHSFARARQVLASRVWERMVIDRMEPRRRTTSSIGISNKLVRHNKFNIIGDTALNRLMELGQRGDLDHVLKHVRHITLFSLTSGEGELMVSGKPSMASTQMIVLTQLLPIKCPKVKSVQVYDHSCHPIHAALTDSGLPNVSIDLDIGGQMIENYEKFHHEGVKKSIHRMRLMQLPESCPLPPNLKQLQLGVTNAGTSTMDQLREALAECKQLARLCITLSPTTGPDSTPELPWIPNSVVDLELTCHRGALSAATGSNRQPSPPHDYKHIKTLTIKSMSGSIDSIRQINARFSKLKDLVLDLRSHHSPHLRQDLSEVLSYSKSVQNAVVYCCSHEQDRLESFLPSYMSHGRYTQPGLTLLEAALPHEAHAALRSLYLEGERDAKQHIKAVRLFPGLREVDVEYTNENVVALLAKLCKICHKHTDIWFNLTKHWGSYVGEGSTVANSDYGKCLLGSGPRKLVDKARFRQVFLNRQ